jgi:hypothetical protein
MLAVMVVIGGLIAATPAQAAPKPRSVVYAVYGDAPYGTAPSDTAEFQATPAFIGSINADPDVSLVAHVGDIHSGKQYCTEAYDRSIADLWRSYQDPLIYTPGDNEWTDCHKPGEGGGSYDAVTQTIKPVLDPATGQSVDYAAGDPIANLALVRSIFFPTPGATLGGGHLRVLSQAQLFSPSHPADRQFVENVMWIDHDVLFVTVNVPGGSNNDTDRWFGVPTMSAAQAQETADRTAADIRWLDVAFLFAQLARASSVAIVAQADMWDLDGKTADHLTAFNSIVDTIATRTSAFGKPVLMFNGDSHMYRSDNPLSPTAPCAIEGPAGTEVACDSVNANHPGHDVPNFHRIVVHGSTFPLEWLKLTINPDANGAGPHAFGPFSWQRMPQPLP